MSRVLGTKRQKLRLFGRQSGKEGQTPKLRRLAQSGALSGRNGTTLTEWLSDRYARNGYRFVPLVRRDLSLVCGLEILILRPEPPGAILVSGDLDNRLKTLFDALKMPRDKVELGSALTPADGEDPFFCLLEDDSVITHATIETDLLLEPVFPAPDPNEVHLIVKVKLRPYNFSPANQGFG